MVYAPYACRTEICRGRLFAEPEAPTRTCFQRDRDRIIHSVAFRRLQYKTQVFVYHEGDHYRTRLTHSLEVAQIARSIARVLQVDEDLTEAVALAHDLGHTPFGHAGEEALDGCMSAYGGFDHNGHALRLVTSLEKRYADFDGLNLTWDCLEGLVKHNGPLTSKECPLESLPEAIVEYQGQHDLELHSFPSAEAQIAALSDDIAYNNHDIDDGLRAGVITVDQLLAIPLVGQKFQTVMEQNPGIEQRRLVHEAVRRLIAAMVDDLLSESRRRLQALAPKHPDDIRYAGQPVIAFSDEMVENNRALKAFLFDNMYRHFKVNRIMAKAKRVVTELFDLLFENPSLMPNTKEIKSKGLSQMALARAVSDYIAGMTDRFAYSEHRRLFELSPPY